MEAAGRTRLATPAAAAVSYTHLDVYKRQGQAYPVKSTERIKSYFAANSGRVLMDVRRIEDAWPDDHRTRCYHYPLSEVTGDLALTKPCLLYTSRCV